MDRFRRTEQLLGREVFQKLQSKRVTVVGLGAVGGYALEGLARAGVQHLRIVDYDTIQTSNINRQIIAMESTIGRSKAEVLQERLRDINPNCTVEALQIFAAEETLEEILSPKPDLLIDAIDSLNPKTQLLHGAYVREIPTISSMGAALRTDPSFIRTGDIFDTSNCPLARHIRKRLRRREVGRGINCVYSTEKVIFDYTPPEEDTTVGETPFSDRGRARNILGSLPTITGIFGLTIANLAIFQLTKA
ncbi:MAG: tRNA A37 threonylcarbamoyladenosine dehydratase [Desulforhopalus sp.]|jgi:tRNA A37 threonylcarbamoyladenosine dehydratase